MKRLEILKIYIPIKEKKLIKCFLSLIFCVTVGFYFSEKYKKRIVVVESLIRFNASFLINVKYDKKTIPEFIEKYNDENLTKILNEFNVSKREKREINLSGLVEKEVLAEAENYFNQLGISDSATQQQFVESYGKVFEGKLEDVKKKYSALSKVFPKIGILTGAMFFIALL